MDRASRREFIRVAAAAAAVSPAALSYAPQPSLRLPRDVRVAIIGFEGHYSEILEVASANPQVKLVAVAEQNPALSKRASANRLLSEATPYEDYRQMLDKEALDIVAVCGQNHTRARIVQECADRRLAIVAEKPLAMDLEELEATRRSIAANGVRLTILLPMRFSPVYQRMRAIVQNGEIGEVVCMAAQKSYKLGERPDWMKKRATFGGIIPYIGIHMVDLMLWTSGREFVEASAFQSNVGFPAYGEMENNAAVIFKLDNQGTATVRLDYLRPAKAPTHGDDRLRLAGTKGVVEAQEANGLWLITGQKPPEQIRDLPAAGFLFADFLESVYKGKRHLISLEEIFRVNEIVLKAREAAERHTIVRV
ncbi:MAG: Gfo/Idh/MocA family oxidoreductase [Acidobacteria bacterium]|nr:Gfo/Idh/MocA family oxidoreductase [Acidobacteriota bacterium]